MAITDRTIENTRRGREQIAGIIQRLADEITEVMANPTLSHHGKADETARRYDQAVTEIDTIVDRFSQRAATSLAAAQSALDSHLGVTEERLATKATVYAGLIAESHRDIDRVLRVLKAQYADPVVRRLLLDTIEVVSAGLDGAEQKDLDVELSGIHAEGRRHLDVRETELREAADQAQEFADYVALIRQIAHTALEGFVVGRGPDIDVGRGETIPGAPIIIDDPTRARDHVQIILERTESAFARYEEQGRSVYPNRPGLVRAR